MLGHGRPCDQIKKEYTHFISKNNSFIIRAYNGMITNMTDQKHYHGHRARLRQRFLQGGAEALADYELLEMLLMQALPRRDVKPLAKNLIARFESFNNVLEAPVEELLKVTGMGETSATSIKLAHGVAVQFRKKRIEKQKIEDRLGLLDYLYAKISTLKHEEFHVIYLDSKNHILGDECLFKGTVNVSTVYPREVVKAALEKGATTLVLVHNHPSGDPTPSQDDFKMTVELTHIAKPLGIAIYDHIIIGNNAHYSFKDHGEI